jgi:hypothetical protein
MCALCKPPNAAHDTLVFASTFKERGILFVFIFLWTCVDWEARPKGGSVGGNVAVMNAILLNKVRRKTCLAKVDLNHVWSN